MGILADYTSLAAVGDNCDANPGVTQTPTTGTMISGNTWWNFPIDDVDFSKSEIELSQNSNLYQFWVRTTNGSRKIKTSWNSPSYRAISVGTYLGLSLWASCMEA